MYAIRSYYATQDNTVTIRERDTMEQHRVAIDELHAIIGSRLKPIL